MDLQCPLSGVKRTSLRHSVMSAFDPKRTFGPEDCCHAKAMRRRDYVRAIVGSATAWPLTARAQQSKSMRRVGALMPYSANDPEAQNRNAAFLQALQQLGWTVGQNVQIEYRWGRRQ